MEAGKLASRGARVRGFTDKSVHAALLISKVSRYKPGVLEVWFPDHQQQPLGSTAPTSNLPNPNHCMGA